MANTGGGSSVGLIFAVAGAFVLYEGYRLIVNKSGQSPSQQAHPSAFGSGDPNGPTAGTTPGQGSIPSFGLSPGQTTGGTGTAAPGTAGSSLPGVTPLPGSSIDTTGLPVSWSPPGANRAGNTQLTQAEFTAFLNQAGDITQAPAELVAAVSTLITQYEDQGLFVTGPGATNPVSGAFGLGQDIGTTWTAYAVAGHTNANSALDQLITTFNYVRQRYGTGANLLAHERAYSWY